MFGQNGGPDIARGQNLLIAGCQVQNVVIGHTFAHLRFTRDGFPGRIC